MSKLAPPNPELLLYIMILELAEFQQIRMFLKALPIPAGLYMDLEKICLPLKVSGVDSNKLLYQFSPSTYLLGCLKNLCKFILLSLFLNTVRKINTMWLQ